MMLTMLWHFLSSFTPQSVEELTTILLKNKGITTNQEKDFFDPKHPTELTEKEVGFSKGILKKAAALIHKTGKAKKKIIVFGDYDADGICATAVLWETLFSLGYEATPFIPSREKHGYGLSDKALDDILADPAKKPALLITVDNGIVAKAAFARLKKVGVQTILTDHHQPEGDGSFPEADIIMHTPLLCGTTVSWMLARELSPKKAENMIELCGIATIADQVPLLGANRSFAKHGIDALRKTRRIGLLALFETASLDPQQIDTHTVNYAIAPRINAMGRIGDAKDALRALCTRNKERAYALMESLQSTNTQRQELTVSMYDQARILAKDWEDHHIIVIAHEDFHEGVIGLVAGKLVEEFSKPAIVISRTGIMAKASARSVAGVNVTELIRQVREHLSDVGGHPMAAGFSLLSENIEIVQKLLGKIAKKQIDKTLLTKRLVLDCELPPSLCDMTTVKLLETFEPFGSANPVPLFALRLVVIHNVSTVGKDAKHLRLQISVNNEQGKQPLHLQAIGFGLGHLLPQLHAGQTVDLAAHLQRNSWNGRDSAQLVIKDVVGS